MAPLGPSLRCCWVNVARHVRVYASPARDLPVAPELAQAALLAGRTWCLAGPFRRIAGAGSVPGSGSGSVCGPGGCSRGPSRGRHDRNSTGLSLSFPHRLVVFVSGGEGGNLRQSQECHSSFIKMGRGLIWMDVSRMTVLLAARIVILLALRVLSLFTKYDRAPRRWVSSSFATARCAPRLVLHTCLQLEDVCSPLAHRHGYPTTSRKPLLLSVSVE